MKIEITYFSGTGGTKLAAEKLCNSIKNRGDSCILTDISSSDPVYINDDCNMFIVMYPVYAGVAPKVMRKFLSDIKPSKSTRNAAVISISGGGEVAFNKSNRIQVIKTLQSKNYNVIYEDMIIMPSNWAARTPETLIHDLFKVLDEKIKIITDILVNKRSEKSLSKINFDLRSGKIIQIFGRIAGSVGFPIIGKFYKDDEKCNGCSICAKSCPSANIDMVKGKPHFGWKCYLCMRCIYNCPLKAIKAGPFSFMILKEGYDIDHMAALSQHNNGKKLAKPVSEEKGWLKVAEYIKELEN